MADACVHVRAWLAQPYVRIVDPGPRHAEILFELLEALGTAGNLTTDAPWRCDQQLKLLIAAAVGVRGADGECVGAV